MGMTWMCHKCSRENCISVGCCICSARERAITMAYTEPTPTNTSNRKFNVVIDGRVAYPQVTEHGFRQVLKEALDKRLIHAHYLIGPINSMQLKAFVEVMESGKSAYFNSHTCSACKLRIATPVSRTRPEDWAKVNDALLCPDCIKRYDRDVAQQKEMYNNGISVLRKKYDIK